MKTCSPASLTEHNAPGDRHPDSGGETLYGAHTCLALENFPLTGRAIHPELIRAYGQVKLACAQANRRLGVWKDDAEKADAVERACIETAEGRLTEHVVVDLLQGGAGTSRGNLC